MRELAGMQYLVSINACSFARKSFYTSVTWSGIVRCSQGFNDCVLTLYRNGIGSVRLMRPRFAIRSNSWVTPEAKLAVR